MRDKTNLIDDEIPAYKKKSKKKGQPRSDHKHTYETVLLIYSEYDTKQATKVCTICGRIGEVDKDESLYEVHPDPDVKRWMVWRKELSEKALSLPKWQAKDFFAKFAIKMED